MKLPKQKLFNAQKQAQPVRKITYTDGGTAYVFKKANTCVHNNLTRRHNFSPVNRNEPMTKTAYKRTLHRYFERLIELDLEKEKCLFLTLTICDEKYNSYSKISGRFKHFIYEIRSKVGNSYVGTIRFIEVQQKGFFHIHCVLIFNSKNINLTWRELHKIWGLGYVKIKPVNYLIGLFDYLTNQKHNAKKEDNNKFTRYPKGAKVIYISPNLPKCKSETISISVEECSALIRNEECIGHLKIHKYFDTETQKIRVCIDKMVLVQIFQKGGRA